MYNSGFVYLLLTIIAISNGATRIAMNTEKPDKKGTMVELQLKKVFAQLAALFMMCTYLSLVEDVTGRRLDAVAGLTLGVVLGAAGFSVMENEVLAYAHTIIRIINRRVPIDTECRICKAPKCEICCHERAAQRIGAGMTGQLVQVRG
ncbi:hypothetical protein M758_5G106500 [Ceratodon purpureus]|nr:hypothetical protein M758_5G106500 [Ceratodon purpureus]